MRDAGVAELRMTECAREDSTGVETATEDGFAGLCRVCGGTVPPSSDQNSCTPSLCSEQCLAKAISDYWAAYGAKADVTLREGYARFEGFVPTA
jgi:hypothetical protein